MTGILEIKCCYNDERYVFGSTSIKSTIAQAGELLKYGLFPNDTMQDNYAFWLEFGIEFNVLKVCTKKNLTKIEQFYLVQHKDDLTIINERDENGQPIGLCHRNLVEVGNDWQQLIDQEKGSFRAVTTAELLQIRQKVLRRVKGEM